MEFINIKEYRKSMGILINLSKVAIPNSTHISYDDLVVNYTEYLDKDKKYYLYCNGGVQSRKAYNILKYKGYKVVVVLK